MNDLEKSKGLNNTKYYIFSKPFIGIMTNNKKYSLCVFCLYICNVYGIGTQSFCNFFACYIKVTSEQLNISLRLSIWLFIKDIVQVDHTKLPT